NPLFKQKDLPNFRAILPEHVEPGITQLAQTFEEDFQDFENKLDASNVSWESIVEPLEKINSKLEFAWGVVSHLNRVKNSSPLREAYQKVRVFFSYFLGCYENIFEVQPSVVKASTLVSQSKLLYTVLQRQSQLDEGQGRIVMSMLRAARNGGVGLEREKKERFNDIRLKLAELSNNFSNNVLDSIKQFSIIVNDKEKMQGLPPSFLQLTADDKREANADTGPWKLTLDMPCFEPFMKYSENRELRERMYKAFISKASSGQTDNSKIIEEIRDLRQEKAELLGFKDYANLSLDSKMAGTPENVWNHITELKTKSKNAAEWEIKQLQMFADKNGFSGKLQLWDIPYWAEKQRQHLFSYSDEQLRPYFPLERVLEGLFQLTSEILGVSVKAADGEAEVWHKDVRFFKIYENSKKTFHMASFFLDPYSRPAEKSGGAWMDQCVGKSILLHRKPVAYLVCNQSPPSVDGKTPSLMTFREVETLFHEFGHGLQHMLTTVPYSDAAGINNVEWDAVEVPSQFMENWVYDRTTMDLISGHYQTGDPLPDDVFKQVCKARQYMAGSQMLRQLYFSALDMELHASREHWLTVLRRIADEFTVIKPHPNDRFPCGFLHIFSSSYAAGYYSYKWAELMSADAFSAFQEKGLDNRDELAKVGKRFRDTILAKGGSRHPRDVFEEFRGRPAKPDALLALYGLS
ncbi:predicted protein, partial [Nematostella vectensis]